MHFNQDNVVPFGSNYPVSGLPPQNIEAEEAILGGIMLDPEAMTRVSDRLVTQAFYISAHSYIYQAAGQLHATYQPTDLLSVTAWLADQNLLNRIGGRNKLAPNRHLLRNSGEIFEVCDQLIMLYRDAVYTKDPSDGTIELIVEKNRLYGKLGTATMLCDLSTSKFLNLAR